MPSNIIVDLYLSTKQTWFQLLFIHAYHAFSQDRIQLWTSRFHVIHNIIALFVFVLWRPQSYFIEAEQHPDLQTTNYVGIFGTSYPFCESIMCYYKEYHIQLEDFHVMVKFHLIDINVRDLEKKSYLEIFSKFFFCRNK